MLEINKNYCGDTIELMKQMDAESTQLILTSPPYNASIRKDNHKYPGGNYEDDLSDEEYVEWSVKIFKEYYRILKDTGTIYLQMDTKINHWIRCIMDDIFGYDNMRNEIIWFYNTAPRKKSDFGKRHDIIYRYSKTVGSQCCGDCK